MDEKDFRKELVKAKSSSESYIVLSMYKNTELFFDSELKTDNFHIPAWKFYFSMLDKAIGKGNKVIDDIVMGITISDHSERIQEMYEKFGGWNTIQNGMSFVQEENFDSYITDVRKYNALLSLHDFGYPVQKKYETFKGMNIEEIQSALEGFLHGVFADAEVSEKTEDLRDGLQAIVDEANEGNNQGFPYHSKMLNDTCNGQNLGTITMLSANSGIGKTFMTLAQILPKMIEFGEKLTIMANEEDSKKWKREIITWAINNVLENGEFEKKRFQQGKFTKDEYSCLTKASAWLTEKMEKNQISFISFRSFSMKKAIKTIKKQNALYGINYFVLDTLKLDSDEVSKNEQAWLELMNSMVRLDNAIKPSGKNVHVWVTYQLGKSAMLSKYLSQNSLGVSKNVVDVVSVLLLARKALETEKEGGKTPVQVKTKEGYLKTMDPEKEYFIIFLGKNRFGETNRQLVVEVDMGRNIMNDFGTCLIEQDF